MSIDVSKSGTPSQILCPMGEKATKRKIMWKGGATSALIMDFLGMKFVIRKRSVATFNVNKGKGGKEHNSVMFEEICKNYEITCNYVFCKFSN